VGAFSALQPVGRLYPCPQWVPFIHLQRRHASHRHERPLLAKEGTIQGIFASTFVIHRGTRFFYMPQSWDIGQILSLPLRRKACGGFFRCPKNPTNLQTRVPEASVLTTRPPKPSSFYLSFTRVITMGVGGVGRPLFNILNLSCSGIQKMDYLIVL